MKNKSELREIIITVLYQVNIINNTSYEYNIEDLIKEKIEIENNFVNDSIKYILENEKSIIELANEHMTKNWTIDRLNKVDQAILKLGIYELKHSDTPSIVAINEAVELSKQYSDAAVTKLINAVLDSIYHNCE